ncbi:MAG: EcsC family protein, partial [Cyclobacteriaceae bacterium]
LMGFVDLPAFLAIKMKMLFEIAAAYGHDVKNLKERLFILYIFKLAFSSQKTRNETILLLEDWKNFAQTLPDNLDEFDWRSFQLEYRDYMDLAKLAQLIPIIGAGVGAIANYNLSKQLGEMAINAYRLRYFSSGGLLEN